MVDSRKALPARHGALRLLAVGLALAASPGVAAAQHGALRVLVVDSATRAPLARAGVELLQGPRGRTSGDGVLLLRPLAPGTWVVDVNRLGYARRQALARVSPQGMSEVVIALAQTPVQLESLEASADRRGVRTARLRAFYARAGTGSGLYLTRSDIERLRPREVSDLFRGLPGMTVIPTAAGDRPAMEGGGAGTTRREGTIRGNMAPSGRSNSDCRIRYFLDGTPLDVQEGQLNAEIEPSEIEGIEVYRRSSTAPAQFRRADDGCGIILIWKRERIDSA